MEAIIKLAGLGIYQYFRKVWNIFDFVLVLASIAGIAANFGSVATLFRIVRVARVIRLVKVSKGLQRMFRTLIYSIPQLINVGGVLILVFFIFACVGMNLFGGIKHGEFLNDDANFDGFFLAMLTLFRISTGESYNGIMHDCSVRPPFCIDGENCGDRIIAPLYFIFFYIMSAFILLNLLVAIILDQFQDTKRLEAQADSFVLTPSMLERFQQCWEKVDPNATRFVTIDGLKALVKDLDFPLGLKRHPGIRSDKQREHEAVRLLAELDVPNVEGEKYPLLLVLQSLANNAIEPEWIDLVIKQAPPLRV